jgi:membrane-bound inhibitor of C-type lysozyme
MKRNSHQYAFQTVSLLLLLILAGCSGTPKTFDQKNNSLSQSQKPQTYVFKCDDSYNFVARQDNDIIWLFLPYKTVKLPQVPSGSGFKYSNGEITFWLENDKAKLETGEKQFQSCQNNRARAIWEHAKLNGVDFRAVGNEPGWYLEIYEGRKVRFIADYGIVRYNDFDLPDPQIDPEARKTLYTFVLDEHELEIIIEGKTCRDTMIDEQYESTVTVNLDGKIYHGCGRPLH